MDHVNSTKANFKLTNYKLLTSFKRNNSNERNYFKLIRAWVDYYFFSGPHCVFICYSRAGFQSKRQISCQKIALRVPDVAPWTYVAPSWIRGNEAGSYMRIMSEYPDRSEVILTPCNPCSSVFNIMVSVKTPFRKKLGNLKKY